VGYLKENKKLYEKVLERGHPAPENFPVSNRIIAGMPIGVIIVEGKQYRGSLITAQLAMEFGREAFRVPGNVTEDVSFAPNLLIKQGANLMTNAEDVIEELPTPVRAALVPSGGRRVGTAKSARRGRAKSIREKRFTSYSEPKNPARLMAWWSPVG
jgi:predicted Rossmann fold nucleotide-binding protein DprA/Smf involved in DNA uptake